MLNLAKHDPSLVAKIEDLAIELIKLQSTCGIMLPEIGDQNKRKLIIELLQSKINT